MENAAEALKMAFAVLIFVIAITISFVLVSQAKSTATTVLYASDKTNYYDHMVTNSVGGNRKVTVDTIISMMYRYLDNAESFRIKVIDPTKSSEEQEIFNLEDIIEIPEDSKRKVAIDEVVAEKLLKNYKDGTFIEEFDEAVYGGKYLIADDGTKIVETAGGTRIYITYTLD